MRTQNQLVNSLRDGFCPSGNLQRDTAAFLKSRGYPKTAAHCSQVAAEAQRLAQRFGAKKGAAEAAGLLHDISAIIPNSERVAAAHALGVNVLPEEESFPLIVHQKLSAVIARELFGVTDTSVLHAIGCHTTLKAGAGLQDKVLFVADKVKWDQAGRPPYLDVLLAALERSLDAAVHCYLDYLWQRRDSLGVIHPWFVAAYEEMSQQDATDKA